MAKRKNYFNPGDGREYYHGEKFSTGSALDDVATGTGYNLNTYNYTPGAELFREYQRQLEEEERQRQRDYLKTSKMYNDQIGLDANINMANGGFERRTSNMGNIYDNTYLDEGASKGGMVDKAKQLIADASTDRLKELEDIKTGNTNPQAVTEAENFFKKYGAETQKAANDWMEAQKSGKLDAVDEASARLSKLVGNDNKAYTDALTYAGELYDFNYKKDRDFNFMNDDETYEYMTLKLNSLNDNEKEAIKKIREGESLSFNTTNVINGKGKYLIDEGKKDLADLGWDQKKIDEYYEYAQRLQNMYDTQAYNQKFNASDDEKYGVDNKKATGRMLKNSAYSLASFIPGSYATLKDSAKATLNAWSGNEWFKDAAGLGVRNRYGESNLLANASEYAQNQVTQNVIGNDHPIGQAAYGIGMSTAQAAEVAAMSIAGGNMLGAAGFLTETGELTTGAQLVLKAATTAPFFGSAYNSAYNEARDRGLTAQQASALGFASGAAEAITEEVSLDAIMGEAKKQGTSWTIDTIKSILTKQGFEEGKEEMYSDVLNIISDYLIAGDKSERETNIRDLMEQNPSMSRKEAAKEVDTQWVKQLILDGVGGYVSGVLLGFGSDAISIHNNAKNIDSTTKVIKENAEKSLKDSNEYKSEQAKEDALKYGNNPTQFFADYYEAKDEETQKVKERLEAIAEKERNGEKVTDRDKNFIAENVQLDNKAIMEILNIDNDSYIPGEYRTATTNITADEAYSKIYKAVEEKNLEAFGEAVNEAKNSRQAGAREYADSIMSNATIIGKLERDGFTRTEINDSLMSSEEAYKAGLDGNTVSNNMSQKNQMAYNEGTRVRIEQEAKTTIKSKDAVTNAVTQTKQGNSVRLTGKVTSDGFVTSDGNVIKTEDLNLTSESATVRAYANTDKYKAVATKQAYINGIEDGTNINQYSKDFDTWYKRGLTPGMDFEIADKGATISMSDAQKKNAFYAGVAERQAKNTLEFINGISKSVGTGSGKYTNSSSVNDENMNIFAQALAIQNNCNVEVVDEIVENGKVNKQAMGYYIASDGTIQVTADAFKQILHEQGHFVEKFNKEGFDQVRESIIKVSSEILGTDKLMKYVEGVSLNYRTNTNHDGNYDDITSEMVNDALVTILTSEKGRQVYADYLAKNYGAEQATKIGKTAADYVRAIGKALKSMFKDTKNDTNYQKFVRQNIDKFDGVADEFIKALDGAVKNAQGLGENYRNAESEGVVQYSLEEEKKINELIEPIGISFDAKTESAYPSLFSLKSWNASDYANEINKASEELSKALNISKKKARKYINDINSIAKIIADDQARLDYEADENNSSVVSNSEYGASIDFSTICKKRRLYTGTLQAIQKQIGNRVITMNDYLDIRNAMLEDGLETTCGCCYVEGSRVKLGQYMEQFIKRYAKDNPPYVPTMYEVTMPDGIRQLRAQHPEVYKAREYFLNRKGQIEGHTGERNLFGSQGKPKDYTERTDYRGELLDMFYGKPDVVKDKNRNGGLRIQSFSDFEIVNLIDAMQVIMDMSRCGLAGQAYTKVYEFANALGQTGLKINLSLMGAGVDANGDLILDEINGMKKSDAIELRNKYSKNVGTIIVCFTDEQIKAAMKSDYIDFIIPFHRSQWSKSQYEALGLPENTRDYTIHQNDRQIKDNGKLKKAESNHMPNEYWNFNKTGRENAEHYIEMCNEENKAPKFPFLLEKKDGNYYLPEGSDYDGYFKLLIDFKMYDNDGKGAPQKPVKPVFDMRICEQMLKDYTGGHDTFPVNDKIANEFSEKIKARGKEFTVENKQYSIKENSTEKERYEFLKEKEIEVVSVDVNKAKALSEEFDINEQLRLTDAIKHFKQLAAKLNILNTQYNNDDVKIEFEFSGQKISESVNKQKGIRGIEKPYGRLAEMMTAFGDVIDNAILIEKHSDRYKDSIRQDNNLNVAYVLVSAYEIENDVVPVKMVVKQFDGNVPNVLHVVITLPEIKKAEILKANQINGNTSPSTNSKYMLADVLGIIKKDFSNNERMGKYIPWHFAFGLDSDTMDSEYIKSVNSGDFEKAQEMVDKAADLAGYKKHLYHGTGEKFYVFNRNREGIHFGTLEQAQHRASTHEKQGKTPRVVDAYVRANSPLTIHGDMMEWTWWNIADVLLNSIDGKETERYKIERQPNGQYKDYGWVTESIKVDTRIANNGKVVKELRKLRNPKNEYTVESGLNKLFAILKQDGVDSIRYVNEVEGQKDDYSYILFDSNQIKESSAVTYDNDGNIIPLSERFERINEDIRYSLKETPLDLASEIVDLAYDIDDYGAHDEIGWSDSSEAGNAIDTMAEDIAQGKTGYIVDTLEEIIYDDDIDNAVIVKAKDLLNKISQFTADKADIKYSLQSGDEFVSLDDLYDDELSIFMGDATSILEEGMEVLKNQTVDEKKVRGLATRLKNELGSSYSAKELGDNLVKAFAYMQTQEHVDYNTMMKIMEEIALPVIENVTNLSGQEEYKDFISTFKSKKIALSNAQMTEVINNRGTYAQYKQEMMPITISKNGSSLEGMWDELCDMYPYLFDRSTSEGDMPLVLMDALDAMRPTVESDYGADAGDAARDLAMRIIEEYIGGEQGKKLKKKNDAYKAKLKEQYSDRLKSAKERLKNRNDRILADKQAKIIAREKNKAQRVKENRLAREYRKKISSNVNKIITWIDKSTENNHVPTSMRGALIEFARALDFVEPVITKNKDGLYETRVILGAVNGKIQWSEPITGNTKREVLDHVAAYLNAGYGSQNQIKWTQRMQTVKDLYEKAFTNGEVDDPSLNTVIGNLDASIYEQFKDMLARNNGTADINNLSSSDLRLINNITRNIMSAINKGNKANSMNETISELGHSTIERSTDKEIKSRWGFGEAFYRFFRIDNVNARLYMKLIGDSGWKIYKSIREGFNTRTWDIKKAQDYVGDAISELGITTKDIKEWTGLGKDSIHSFNLSDGEIQMTTTQIMSLYETLKRVGAKDRIVGGIEIDDIDRGRFSKKVVQDKAIHLTENDISILFGTLTDDQKALADKMQKYMAVECSKDGNEVSEKLYGYSKYEDTTYFPYTVDKSTVDTRDSSDNRASYTGIERSGFTHTLKDDSTNPLVIRDIFDVFTDHVVDMASYHGYAAANKDTLRWLNYKEKSTASNGFVTTVTNKDAIDKILGTKAGAQYLKTFLLDLNGQNKSSYRGTLTEKLMGNYKAAAVGANLRVILQQPTAYFRAWNTVDAKYLIGGLAKGGKYSKVAIENNATALWKSWGYYETNIGKSMKEVITGVTDPVDNVTEKMMALAGKADDFTWGCLYAAVELEQKAQHRGENLTDEEFRKLVNDRFDDVVDQTQVVDSTLHRTQVMRSKDKLNVIQTAFLAEPVKSYNMLLESAISDVENKSARAKLIGRAVIAWGLSNIATAAAAAIADAFRYKDEDDEFWDVWAENFRSNVFDNLNIFTMLPILKELAPDVIGLITGETSYKSGTDRLDLAAFNSIIDAINTDIKAIKGSGNKTGYGLVMANLKPMSQITGIPLYNMTRDMTAIAKFFGVQAQTTIKKATDYEKDIIKAGENGREDSVIEKQVTEAFEQGKSIKEIRGYIKSHYSSDYTEAIDNSDTETLDAITESAVPMLMNTGMTFEEATEEVESWGDSSEDDYKEIDNIIKSGSGDVETEVNRLIEEKHKDPDKLINHIMNYFGTSVEYEKSHSTTTGYYDMVDKAIKAVDPKYSYEEAKADMEKKAQLKQMTNDLFDKIDINDGRGAKQLINDMARLGKTSSDIRGDISDEYHKRWKSADSKVEKDKIKQQWISSTTLVINTLHDDKAKDPTKAWESWENSLNN